MSYDQQKDNLMLGPGGMATAFQATVIAATTWSPAFHPQTINEFSFLVRVVPTTAPLVVALKKRITPNSSSGEITIATLTIPLAAVIGQVYYKRGLDVIVRPGDELIVDPTTVNAVATGTFGVGITPSWEMHAKNAEMVLSA